MSTIFHIMQEEYDRLIEAEKAYSNSIAQMPKGTPRIKKIRDQQYLYLAHRESKKVVDDYIGLLNSKKKKKILKQVEKSKRFTLLLKETKQMLRVVKKVLRGKI